jgi:hypothetical protein
METQIFKSDGSNTVFDLTRSNIDTSSIKVFIDDVETTSYTFLNPSFIVLEDIQPLDAKIKVVFSVKDTEETINKDMIKRITELEKAIQELVVLNTDLMKAVNNRVPVKTFNAWKALIESKVGLKIIQTNMTDVGSELVNMTNHR